MSVRALLKQISIVESSRQEVYLSDILIERLRLLAADFVAAEPDRIGTEGFWKAPLLVSAPVDDRFDILPQVASDEHLHPRDLLPSAKSLIVFFIPFKRELVKENKTGDRPSRNWGLAYVQTNDLIHRLSREAEKLLTAAGPLMDTDAACLLKAGKKCGECIEACPMDALAENAFERQTCWARLIENRAILDYFSDLPETTHVCGKCAALVPCSFLNPVAGLK